MNIWNIYPYVSNMFGELAQLPRHAMGMSTMGDGPKMAVCGPMVILIQNAKPFVGGGIRVAGASICCHFLGHYQSLVIGVLDSSGTE